MRFWKKGTLQKTSRITYDVIWNVILFTLITLCVGIFLMAGVGAGYFASLVKDEPIRSYESMKNDIYDYEATSRIYFDDNKLIGELRSELHRDEIKLDDVSDVLIDAVIATEDQYFHQHNGVVPKAIVRAVLQEATNSETKSGGSTLTQQLIKNQVLTNEVSFDRKAKEILLAMRLENFFEKDEILEAYLNVIPYGRNAAGENIAGIQTAAKGVFNVDASELNLAQAAYLAGLPQSPSAYTPFTNKGEMKDDDGLQAGLNRMQTVLRRMVDEEFITSEEYEEALAYDITDDLRESMPSPRDDYPVLTEQIEKEAKDILQVILAEEDGYTEEDLADDADLKEHYRQLADQDIRRKGYNIHSTIDKEIYIAQQKVAKEYAYYGPDQTNEKGETKRIEMGSALIENSTGRIISFVGNRDFTRGESEYNYAFNVPRSNGSTMKPILPYAVALELGELQPGGPVPDVEITVGPENHVPSNYSNRYYGIVSAREALAKSHNVSAQQVYDRVIDQDPVTNYGLKMGIPFHPNDFGTHSVSIGGMTEGLSVAENASAFTTLANDGKHADMYMIDKITDHDGEVIYEHEQTVEEVYSPQTAYLTIDMMRDVLTSGTGTYLPDQLSHGGVDWAGKTGTTDDYADAWFVGVNPKVTMASWQGYEDKKLGVDYCPGCSIPSYSHRNLKMWAELMNVASDINPDLVAPKESFKRPDGIVERSYCLISGKLPSELCKKAGLVQTDLFNEKYVPTEEDDSLISGSYVLVDGKAVKAGSNTPSEFVKGDGLAFNPAFLKENGYDELDDISQLFPDKNRDLWEKISVGGSDVGSTLNDDGKDPAAPGTPSKSGGNISWSKSSSKDVVGYYIYQASGPDKDFKKIGHTTGTSYSISGNDAIYRVVAVDYFGRSSKPSKEVTVGSFKDPDEDKDDEKDKDKDKDEDKDDEKNEDKDKDDDKDKNKDKDKDKKDDDDDSDDEHEDENEDVEQENESDDE